MNNEAAMGARKSLEDLKRQLQSAQPVFVDSQGRLVTPEEEVARQKVAPGHSSRQTGYVQVKPSRWF